MKKMWQISKSFGWPPDPTVQRLIGGYIERLSFLQGLGVGLSFQIPPLSFQ